jgi:predicted lipoprotein
VVDDITRLESAWSNGFREAFTAPDGTVYSSEADALNAVFHAMFYLESQTKDVKLAHPLGIRDCDADVCPEDLESLYASASIDHIAANLEGFRALFFGIDGSESFDDLLVAAGHEDLVTQVALRLDEADAVIAELDTALVDAISHDLDSALAVHTKVKAVTDLIKNEMSTALLLQVPTEVAGDND